MTMHHVKRIANLPNGDRMESFYWANGGAARVQSRTAFYGPAFGPGAHWSGVDTFAPANGVARFFQGLLMMDGASVASVR